MKKVKYLFLMMVLCLVGIDYNAQIQHNGQPQQWENKSIDQSNIPIIETPYLDLAIIEAEDKVVDGYKETPYRFGIEKTVDIDLYTTALMTELDKGDKIYQLAIHCPKATSINFLFNEFNIPEGGELSIWNEDRTEFMGVYTHLNNKEYNSFAVGLIHDDKVVIEYYEPYSVAGQAQINIGTIIHGYRSVINKWEEDAVDKGPYGTSGSCNKNVNCSDGAPWQNEKRGVALILNGGNAWCTGSLINNTNEDGKEYFLTAAHCDANESNWVFYFNHETSGCSGSTGPTNQSISGAVQRASGTTSDYHLVELSANVPSSYNPYYNGWDRSNNAVSSAVGIHHPSGDVKKISFDDDPLQKTNYSSNSTTSSGTHWRIDSWERNTTTEGGSSGSPLFDQNHRIIGQLHGGGAACGNSASDWYGALGNSWNGLKNYLAPGATSTVTLDGYDPNNVGPTCSDGIQNGTETGVDCGGSCAPCACSGTMVNLSITFDNYPEETSWKIKQGGTTVAQGGTYASQTDGSTLNISVCLPNGCYDLVMSDAYGDGICCSYGNGSYTLSGGGQTLASGGSFNSSETTNFCVGTPVATCDDGIQNGNETGIDCGGSCSPEVNLSITFDNYPEETSWKIKQGGTTVAQGGTYGNQADGSTRNFTSCLPAGCYTLTMYDTYGDGICCSYGNGSYTLSAGGATLASGGNFNASQSTNFCVGTNGMVVPELAENDMALKVNDALLNGKLKFLLLSPNPTSDMLNVHFVINEKSPMTIQVIDVQGRVVMTEIINAAEGDNNFRINTEKLDLGNYIMTISSNKHSLTERFVVVR